MTDSQEHLCADYRARSNNVFVDDDEYDWIQKPKADVTPEETIILCSVPGCNNAATILDHHYPYYEEHNKCIDHVETGE